MGCGVWALDSFVLGLGWLWDYDWAVHHGFFSA
jgi:hypothetical protein